ncbi:MAG: inositol monophosphatase [Opitutales bacterium]
MTAFTPEEPAALRDRLLAFSDSLQTAILEHRDAGPDQAHARVVTRTAADTLYGIDAAVEPTVLEWFNHSWPADQPVELVMEGLEHLPEPAVFPNGTPIGDTRWKIILDPIDGTRSFMVDKRSAWILVGIAPQRFADNRLSDVVAAAMTELPVRKQRLADQLSALRGDGAAGIRGCRKNLDTRDAIEWLPAPSTEGDLRHGFGGLVKFFPEGRQRAVTVEDHLLAAHLGTQPAGASPLVFDDQYISTGGQFYEMLAGRDRFLADLRPLLAEPGHGLACHPYDCAAALILQEAGCLLEAPDGSPLDPPLDTTTPVAWAAYANLALAQSLRPLLRRALREHGL